MKLHSDKITLADIFRANSTNRGVYVTAVQKRSQSHAAAFDVSLESDGTPDVDGTNRRRRTNAGTRGAGWDRPTAASWSDWGRIIATLYVIDPEARWGSAPHPTYRDASDFHEKTGGRFLEDAPAELVATVNSAADAWKITRGLVGV